jgi:hypothetical protein
MLALILGTLAVTPDTAPAERATPGAPNPVYDSLLDLGLPVGPGLTAELPPPTMPDGLDGEGQRAVIAALIGADYAHGEFTRKSVVAPQLLRIRTVASADPAAPARGVDVWFVAYDDRFHRWLMGLAKGEGFGLGRRLTREDLARRGIEPDDGGRESFRHVEFDVLGRVQLRATARVVWTTTRESVLIAAAVDPRFRGDPEFPNQWRPVAGGGGAPGLGPARPWDGAGFYLKITRLAEPVGALFVEQHVVFTEPAGWFDGANLLRPKLPLVIQGKVRAMRKEWTKSGEK